MMEENLKTNKSQYVLGYFLKQLGISALFVVAIWLVEIKLNHFELSLDGIHHLHHANHVMYWVELMSLLFAAAATLRASKEFEAAQKVKAEAAKQQALIDHNAKFAESIGKENYDVKFKQFDEQDILGKALLEMRSSFITTKKKEEERNWIVFGTTEVSEILRRNTELKKLSEEVIAFLCWKTNAVQGAFYIVNDDNEQDVYLEMSGSFAYNKKKYLKGNFRLGQGLVGQAAIEKDTVFRTEIPEDYVSITSGLLGEKKPNSILIVPLITNEKVYGAVELASFEKFTQLHIQFVQELGDIIARTIFNVKINERTVRLLTESQKMGEELSEQREQLLQNAEEMQATQEEIKRANVLLEEQIEEVQKSQQRTQVLLENASEMINIYSADGKVIYASPSSQRILGYAPESIVGTFEFTRVHMKGIETVNKMFEDLSANPDKVVMAQYSYIRPDGGRIWVESTGRNLMHDKSINGILFNTIDITERRKAEREQRERAKMQALSENSLDIIVRFDLHHKISYINPAIEKFTGLQPTAFLAAHIDSIPLDAAIVGTWKGVLETISETKSHTSSEMEFMNADGVKLFMEVNAIPEFGEDGALESTLMILHDITEAKLAEIKIREANQKVKDSINYAKRIQNSIMPKDIVLQQHFKESFMLFRAKDVVSGDFPFILDRGDYMYFAAVDCTGHGVPGALLSVIGSLILQEVTRHEDMLPGQLLDNLHAMVVKTLRQGEEGGENERDGMDVGMCRIHKTTGELQYSGAHRPLYIVRKKMKADEELEELKGDKYPIGGVQYKGREKFTNYETKLAKGDRVFVCSDGYPDQFGGPEEELKKIGPKKIRKVLIDNKDKPMHAVHEALVEQFDTWKGPHKQMDDVLFLGIEFQKY